MSDSNEYADIIRALRVMHGTILAETGEQFRDSVKETMPSKAADALEAVLAERDALKSEAERLQGKLSEADDTICGLCTAGESYRDELDKLARRFALLLYGGRQEATAAILKQAEADVAALLALLAPADGTHQSKDDEALVEIGMQAAYKAEYGRDMYIERTQTNFVESIYKPIITAAIAAIRPHIEAAERERCANVAELHSYPMKTVAGTGYNNAAKEIAAAIRRGK